MKVKLLLKLKPFSLYEVCVIAATLRGPDSQHGGLKWVFTCRLRHLLGAKGGFTRPEPAIEMKELIRMIEEVDDVDLHYLSRVKEALSVMGKLGLIAEDECDVLFTLAHAAICLILGQHDIAMKMIENLLDEHPSFFEW